jgi:hypothetical protein
MEKKEEVAKEYIEDFSSNTKLTRRHSKDVTKVCGKRIETEE